MWNRLFILFSTLLLLSVTISCRSEPQIPVQLAEIDFMPNGHPVDMVFNPSTEYLYITNGRGDHVGVFKGLEQVATIHVDGDNPSSLAIDVQNDWVYAVNQYSNNVTIIQGTVAVDTVAVAGREPRGVAVETQRNWAYVVAGHNAHPPFGERPVVGGHVTVLHGTEVIGTIDLGSSPTIHAIADPVSGYVYVGSYGYGGGQIFVIDGLEVIEKYDVNGSVTAMDVNPKTGDVYVLNSTADRNLSLFRNGQFISSLGFKEDGNGSGGVRNMRVHPVTGIVYVVDFVAHEVIVVENMEIIGRTPVGLGPLKMAIDPHTNNVYVANFEEDTVTVINGTETLATIDVGWYPYGIGVNSNNGWVYVSNTNDDTVTVLGYQD